jgi:hypothetical protein
VPALSDEQIFKLYTLNRRWMNFSLLRYRNFDGHIVSMQQAGTHWLKNMLAHVMSEIYDLPPLEHIQDDSIIGHTKSPPKYSHIPQIVHSHGFPHALTLGLPFLHYPRYVVLVRNIQDSLISHYERFHDSHYEDIGFSEYLLGDARQKKFRSDIYTRIRFLNEWGDMAQKHPEQVLVVRYEDMKADPVAEMSRVCEFLEIKGASLEHYMRAVEATTKDKMAQKPNPDVKTTVVRLERKPASEYFSPKNQIVFDDICSRFLRHDFGYGYRVRDRACCSKVA